MVTKTVSISPTLIVLGESFHRSLLAENKSPMTVKAYMEALRLFDRYAADKGMPREAVNVRREHVEAFIDCD